MAIEHAQAGPLVLGLTGPIACGKTTVGDLLLRLGALARIDADDIVHEALRPGSAASRDVVREFGTEVEAANEGVDRRKLAALVFSDAGALQRLESILHPVVEVQVRNKLAEYALARGVVVLDAVKLLESSLATLCGEVWVVTCNRQEQERRLIEDRNMAPHDAQARIDAGPAFDDSRIRAVIDNSGSREQTVSQVRELWRALLDVHLAS